VTNAPITSPVPAGTSVYDTATVTGSAAAITPTGTVTYNFYPNSTGTGTPSSTQMVTLNANGTVPNSPPTGTLAAGSYSYVAVYSGDPNYTGFTSAVEPLTISSARSVQSGDFATIGFWHNNNGQGLSDKLNGGGSNGTATALGTWLATNFPHLYGADVDPSNPYEMNLTGVTNATVASFYLNSLFDAQCLYKTYAQVMAVALGSYASSSTLAGGNYAQSYGFNVSTGGSGTDYYNVGSDGSALGLANNSNQTVLTILGAADSLAASTTTFNSKLSSINDLFNGINQTGDIS
jgi:hypothetical protein